jgi:hypothetical protein
MDATLNSLELDISDVADDVLVTEDFNQQVGFLL